MKPGGWFHKSRDDFALFSAMVLLAAATVAAAATTKTPLLVTVKIAGTVDLLTDPGVQQELSGLGYNVTTDGLGADQVLAKAKPKSYSLNGYQMAYVPNQVAATAVEQELSDAERPSSASVLGRSRLVVATYRQLLPLLQEAGIARHQKDGVWTFDINAYATDLIKHGGPLHWEDLRGYKGGADLPGPGPIVLSTTDPNSSVLTRMFIAAASYRLNDNSQVTTKAEVQSVAGRLKPCFTEQGNMETGGIPEWNDFLENEMNNHPMALTYESLYVGLAEAHDPRITKDMVMMYVSPELDIQDTLIPLDNTGTTVATDIATDPKIQQIAEKLGFITTTPDRFQQKMRGKGIHVAGNLPTVNPPTYSTLQDIVNRLLKDAGT